MNLHRALRHLLGAKQRILAELYGGDEKWATVSLDSESGEYTLSILPRTDAENWLGVDLDDALDMIFKAQQALMKRQVFGIR